jgi:hypothetical protein
LNRDIPSLVRAAGFELDAVDASYLKPAPPTHAFVFRGCARNAA